MSPNREKGFLQKSRSHEKAAIWSRSNETNLIYHFAEGKREKMEKKQWNRSN